MKLYIDDIRNAPDDTWHVCRTVQSAINAIHQFSSEITDISFDHDISHQVTVGSHSRPIPCNETFQPVAHYLGLLYAYYLAQIKAGESAPLWFPTLSIHSANPVGAQELFNILGQYDLHPTIEQLPAANRLEMVI